uniref:DNA-directed DNA/RNA polymerase mu n=1 Tax=Gasterosteus aculeatus aculeatus TaxID=481459 RepID=G3NEP3_GASAC
MFQSAVAPRARKRSRPAEAGVSRCNEVKFEDVRVFLVERKMGRSRRSFLTQLATSKGFIVENVLSDKVTHVVSEDSQAASLWKWLRECAPADPPGVHVLDISWFTDSMREGKPVAVETRHLIQDAFEVLAENYEFNEMDGSCLAFRRAASVLKSLPMAVRSLRETQDLPCLGEHTKAVMEEVLRCGRSFEVEKLLSDERYQTFKLFTSVFGVGPKTADKWYRGGLRSFSEVLADRSIHLNQMQQIGFLHYGDISGVVSKAEARSLRNIIDEAARATTPAAKVALTGGFCREKEFGHDVDFIVTTPELGGEETLLPKIIDELKKQGMLLYCDYHPSTFDINKLPSPKFEAMDHYAKCFLILRLEGSRVEGGLHIAEGDNRGWRAVRVDLVSPPVDRYAFALLGWSGSRQFERDLRRFARAKRGMLLDNHALYDKNKNEFLAASTEKDIFAHLGLEYIEPWQRNA